MSSSSSASPKPVIHVGEDQQAVISHVRKYIVEVLAGIPSPVIALSGGSAADIVTAALATECTNSHGEERGDAMNTPIHELIV